MGQTLPGWAKKLISEYQSGTVSQFILYGNVNDLIPLRVDNQLQFLGLKNFLEKALFPMREMTFFYDPSYGIRCPKPEMMQDFLRVVRMVDAVSQTQFAGALPKDPNRALFLIERYIRTRIDSKKSPSVAVIIDFAQMIAPMGQLAHMSRDEVNTLIRLMNWAKDPDFMSHDITSVLISENLSDLNNYLAQDPYSAKIELDFPAEAERLTFIEHQTLGTSFRETSDLSRENLAQKLSGLNLVNIKNLINTGLNRKDRITNDFVFSKKKELIEKECFGLLEFFEPGHDLSMVSGHDAAKEWLSKDADLAKKGELDVLPMGYVICGPVGTGKTFLIECYTGSIGIPCVKLLNFRSQWQGVTEGNWEKILKTLRATGPVGVIIDEADAAVGKRESGGDSGTSSRVFSQLASQMGNTKYRGKIIWFLITCRPDLLPVDLKRQGRAEVHIPLFYPHGEDDLKEMFKVMGRKVKAKFKEDDIPAISMDARLSGADIEGILVKANRLARIEGRGSLNNEDLKAAVDDFIPAAYEAEKEMQIMSALMECTSKKFIPERYADISREECSMKFKELKLQLGA
ncbi:ATP-binding protein [Candidatus Riflebacteria bacterium]